MNSHEFSYFLPLFFLAAFFFGAGAFLAAFLPADFMAVGAADFFPPKACSQPAANLAFVPTRTIVTIHLEQ